MIIDITSREDIEELGKKLFKFYRHLDFSKPDGRNGEVDENIPKDSSYEECKKIAGNVVSDGLQKWVDRCELALLGGAKIFGLKINGKIVGGICIIFVESMLDGVLECSELFWYVDDEYRGKGISLLLHAEKYAKQNGAKRMIMMYLINSMPDKLEKLYTRMGFRELERSYIKEL
jgi:GNAT superfamily N-acetyltransferase